MVDIVKTIKFEVIGVIGIPEIETGNKIGETIFSVLVRQGITVMDGDVFVIAQKIVSKLSIRDLRRCGLSRMKALGIKSLADKILDKSFNPKFIKKMSDEEAINYLSSLRQIGRWSSEMVLIFFYNRPNIWPVQDIGLLRAISNNYKKKYLPPKSFVNKLQKKFSPYCTLAVMALWYSVDNEPVQY